MLSTVHSTSPSFSSPLGAAIACKHCARCWEYRSKPCHCGTHNQVGRTGSRQDHFKSSGRDASELALAYNAIKAYYTAFFEPA